MKTICYAFILVMLTLLCCSPEESETLPQEHEKMSDLVLELEGDRDSNSKKRSIGAFIYKNSIWLKPGTAIQLSKPAGKAVVFNPDMWTVLEHKGHLSAYTAETLGYSGCDCGPNEVCINGVCSPSNSCDGGCPSGSTCINGICTPNNPCGGGCPQGTTCVNGACTPNDPCSSCDANETCINGVCTPTEPCGGECPPGQTCINGICAPDPCNDCDENEICVNGECRDSEGVGGIGQVQTSY